MGETSGFATARYTSNGSLDANFSGDGKVTTDAGGDVDVATAVAVRHDGKILVGGTAAWKLGDQDFALVRYTSTGNPDPSFGSGGIARSGRDYFRAPTAPRRSAILIRNSTIDTPDRTTGQRMFMRASLSRSLTSTTLYQIAAEVTFGYGYRNFKRPFSASGRVRMDLRVVNDASRRAMFRRTGWAVIWRCDKQSAPG